MSDAILTALVALLGTSLALWVSQRTARQDRLAAEDTAREDRLAAQETAREDRIAAQQERLDRERVERQNRLEQNKIASYVRLMRAAREMRFLARRMMEDDDLYQKPEVSEEEELNVRINFYTARYEVNIFAPPDTVTVVDSYHKALGDFLRMARKTPASAELKSLRTAARHAQDQLERQVRAEVGFGDDRLRSEVNA